MKDFVTKANKTGGDDSGTATKQGAFEQNSLNDENKNVVSTAGLTPTPGFAADPTPTQLAEAVNVYAQTGHSYQDSGVVNAYTLTTTGSLQQPTSYVDGQKISFVTSNSNTTATTVNISSLGVKNIVTPQGSALSGGEIIAGRNEIIYDSGNDRFVLSPWNLGVLRSQVITFTTSGTYSKSAGLLFAIVEGVGGGGGGGGGLATGIGLANSSSGGSGGGYSKSVINASDLSTSETIVIGASGAGGIGNATGSNGGDTSFGTFFTCSGGVGGDGDGATAAESYSPPAVGSSATGGDINTTGGSSGIGLVVDGNRVSMSKGGDSNFGFGGAESYDAISGNDGSGYGSGGSGVSNGQNQSTSTGGSGATGIIIITEFYGV